MRGSVCIAVVSGILADARGQRGGWWTGRRQEVRAYDKFQGRNSLPSIYDLYPPRVAVHIPAPPEQSGALQVDVEATPDGLRRAAAAVGANVAGVDILPTDDGPVVLEVNAVPGWQGLQAVTEIDLANEIATLVERTARQRSDAGRSREV